MQKRQQKGRQALRGTLSPKAQGGESGFRLHCWATGGDGRCGRVTGAGQFRCSCFHLGFDKLYLPNWESKAALCNPG